MPSTITTRRPRVGIEFRSLADLERTVIEALPRLPRDLDLVVGVPRSGMLAASLIALHRHTLLTDFDSFLEGRINGHGHRLKKHDLAASVDAARRILIVDDSVNSGRAITEVKARLAASSLCSRVIDRTEFGAVFASDSGRGHVDHYFSITPPPRLFSWNLMGTDLLSDACVDIDGVLCVDPTDADNDDGPRYERFLREATPLHVPASRVGHIVTSRLERFRGLTEQWLATQGIEYDELHMLDLPSAEERRRLGAHATFKSEVYGDTGARIFLESDPVQSQQIADATGKAVVCVETLQLHGPGGIIPARSVAPLSRPRRAVRRARRMVRNVLAA